MSVIVGISIVLLSCFVPILGILIGTLVSLTKKKPNIFVLLGISLGFAGIGMHYVYLITDDMFRYVQYMESLSPIKNGINYITQLYGGSPIAAYGLDGSSWPLSGLLLFVTSKLFDYRFIAVLTLVGAIFGRIYVVFKVTEESDATLLFTNFIRLAVIFIDIFVMSFKLPVSGFRWYIATTLILMMLPHDLKSQKIISFRALTVSFIAALFHPVGWIYLFFRVISGIKFDIKSKTARNIYWLVLLMIMLWISFTKANYVVPLLNQFESYVLGDGFTQALAFTKKFFILWFIPMAMMYYRIFKGKSLIGRGNFYYLSLNFILTTVSLPFFLFQRIYPFTFPLLMAYWAYTVIKLRSFYVLDLCIVVFSIGVAVAYYVLLPGSFFPPLDNSVLYILFHTIFWQ